MKQIANEKQYRKLLKELEDLFDCAADPGQRFEELSDLIADYESRHYPIEPPTVGAALRFRMEQAGLNQTEISKMLEISLSRVEEILSNSRPPSKVILRKLHEKLGIPLQHLLNFQPQATKPKAKPAAKFARKNIL